MAGGGKAKKKILGAGEGGPASSGGKVKKKIVGVGDDGPASSGAAGAGDDAAEFCEGPHDVFAPEVELHDEDSSSSDTEISDGDDLDEKHTEDGAHEEMSAPPPKIGQIPGHLDSYAIDDADGVHIGIIKVDKKHKSFNAHCCQLGGADCRDHRTLSVKECRLNRVYSKRLLGFLVQWLRQGHCYVNREDHKLSTMVISPEDQRECREWLRAQPALENLLVQEAEWLDLAWTGPATVSEDGVSRN